MIHTPRARPAIEMGLNARIVARSGLCDIRPGGVIDAITQSISEDVHTIEAAAYKARLSWLFDVDGDDLDARCRQIPHGGVTRLGASAASGNVLTITRPGTSGDLTIPAGTIYGRTDNRSLRYVQDVDAVISDGDDSAPNVRITCLTPGPDGNATTGLIREVVSGPDDITVTNSRLVGGIERETDDELRVRAIYRLASFGGVQPAALMYLATAFRSTYGVRIRHAALISDPATPGYSELMIDDGYGMEGYITTGDAVSGTAPASGERVLIYGAPAADRIKDGQVTVGGSAPALSGGQVPWFDVPERGYLILNEGVAGAGDTWQISGHEVFAGPIAELQATIEGHGPGPGPYRGIRGWRASGFRVRVVPPTPDKVDLTVRAVPAPGYTAEETQEQVRTLITQFFTLIGPGDSLHPNALAAYLMGGQRVRNVTVYQTGASTPLLDDIPPSSPRHRVTVGKLDFS